MEKFLDRVAAHLVEKHGHNLTDVTVFVPNHRSGATLKQRLYTFASQPLWTPHIVTFENWVYQHSDLMLANHTQLLLKAYQCYKKLEGEDSFDNFIGTAEVLINDYSELDLQLVDTDSFFYNLEKLQSMKVYEPGSDALSEYSQRFVAFWKLFRNLYEELKETLLQDGLAYRGMIYKHVANVVDSKLRLNLEWRNRSCYFVGFNALARSEKEILNAIKGVATVEVVSDADAYYVNDELNEAGKFFREYGDNLYRSSKGWQIDVLNKKQLNIHSIGAAKNFGQTMVLSELLSSKIPAAEIVNADTAVVVLDEKLLPDVISLLPASIRSVNVSMGVPLSDTDLSLLIKLLYRLHHNASERSDYTTKPRYYYRHVFALLAHPYLQRLVGDKLLVTNLTDDCLRHNRQYLTNNYLSKHLCDSKVLALFQPFENPISFLTVVHSLLNEIKQQQQLSAGDVMLMPALQKMMQLVQSLHKQLEVSEIATKLSSINSLLSSAIRSERVTYEGNPSEGLQILGIHETRLLDFKNVIVLSLNEGIFPAAKHVSSFIPPEMRFVFGLTTYKDRSAISAYLFYRLMHGAEAMYFTYNTEPDELGGGEPSRFIKQMEYEYCERNTNAAFKHSVFSAPVNVLNTDGDLAVKKTEDLLRVLKQQLSEYGISPSALNTYLRCSLQYYFRYVVKLREQEEIEESMESSTIGTAVHAVLESLYTPHLNQVMNAGMFQEMLANEEEIEKILRQSLSERFDEDNLGSGVNYLLFNVCKQLVLNFLSEQLAYHKLNDGNLERVVLMLEEELKGQLKVNDINVVIRGKVDRVESIGKALYVADYKSGSSGNSAIKYADKDEMLSGPKYAKAMQLMIYAWLYNRNFPLNGQTIRSGIYWLKSPKDGIDTLLIDKNDDSITEHTLNEFESTLQTLLLDILNPEKPFRKTEDVKVCKHCSYAFLCNREQKQ